jgi:plasminogen
MQLFSHIATSIACHNVISVFVPVGSCRTSERGEEYRGYISSTREGFTCQRWADDGQPHSDLQPLDRFYGNVFPDNYCRNPDSAVDGPWCYTTDIDKRYDYCDVPAC